MIEYYLYRTKYKLLSCDSFLLIYKINCLCFSEDPVITFISNISQFNFILSYKEEYPNVFNILHMNIRKIRI